MGLTIRQRGKIARTETTIDQVYADRAAMRGGGVKGKELFIFRPLVLHPNMPIIAASLRYLEDFCHENTYPSVRLTLTS
jgi:hypothetical protein